MVGVEYGLPRGYDKVSVRFGLGLDYEPSGFLKILFCINE